MANKLIFLSHIHEEKELALIIKDALEIEFSGFVDVFVSSDGTSIPAGTNFLNKIEDALVNCIGALYLISPKSVKRPWINFELGAVWVRNVISIKNDNAEIPVLPICHSRMTPSDLPQPLNNLNAVQANLATSLESAFYSLQTAVGGKGKLNTDFETLANQISTFEKQNTIGDYLKKFLIQANPDSNALNLLIDHCKKQPANKTLSLDLGSIDINLNTALKHYESNELKGLVKVHSSNPHMGFGESSMANTIQTVIEINSSTILEFEDFLLS